MCFVLPSRTSLHTFSAPFVTELHECLSLAYTTLTDCIPCLSYIARMRIVLLPNSIEHQCAHRLEPHDDCFRFSRLVGQMLLDQMGDHRLLIASKNNVFTIAVCIDGWTGFQPHPSFATNPETLDMVTAFRSLFAKWFANAGLGTLQMTLDFQYVSLLDRGARNLSILKSAQVFYCCGGFPNSGFLPDYIRRLDPSCKECLEQRVQYDDIVYIGICAGAMLIGRAHLDLLSGTNVRYDYNVGPGAVPCETRLTSDHSAIIQMTTGVGIAFDVWHDRPLQVACFPVIKNHFQWQPFAQANTRVLMNVFRFMAKVPVWYLWPGEGTAWACTMQGNFIFKCKDGRTRNGNFVKSRTMERPFMAQSSRDVARSSRA